MTEQDLYLTNNKKRTLIEQKEVLDKICKGIKEKQKERRFNSLVVRAFMPTTHIIKVDRIKDIRKTLAISATELGERIGVTRQTINSIEYGKCGCNGGMNYALKIELLRLIDKCKDDIIKDVCLTLYEDMIGA